MELYSSFQSDQSYWAREQFPYGLDRCGEFSRQQVKLIIAHGFAYEALDSGVREPANTEETNFVLFCKGEAEAATNHERAWRRFRAASSKPILNVSLEGKNNKPQVNMAGDSGESDF